MRIADNLIVMKDGQIVEQGDFQQLISNDGEFTKITKDYNIKKEIFAKR